MTVAAQMLPPEEPVLGALEPIERYRPHRHPDLKRLHTIAAAAAERLEVIAAIHLEPTWDANLEEDDVRDAWLGFLHTMRLVHGFLRSHATRVLVRDVRKHLHHDPVADRLEEALGAATETVAHLRAWVAVMFDENDDEELGIEVLPRAPQTVGPTASVDVEL